MQMTWKAWFESWFSNRDRRGFRDELQHLLPGRNGDPESLESAIPPKEVTKVALRLKYQIEQVIPCEIEEAKITKPNSPIITEKVVKATQEAGGKEYAACVIYCLLVCKKWFKRQAMLELWDSDLHEARATACEVIAKRIIEAEENEEFLMQETLLKRYSIYINGQVTTPTNVIERAVDLHALLVTGSSGYQKCVKYLWRGWLVQDDEDPMKFVPYKKKTSKSYWEHFDPDRMRTPMYQNVVQISISVIYLVLYTIAINTINHDADLDIVEGILYLFTAGFMFDELNKLWKVGRYYIGFWNVFNSTLYALLTVSFVLRTIALTFDHGSADRNTFNVLSYNFLAFSAPMFWMRLLLFLDTFRFFGAMLVVLKVMMKESLIFFALLIIIGVGFLQAFIGLANVDDNQFVTTFIVQSMIKSVLQAPEFEGFEEFSPPFGIILYYIFTFVIMVILLNILIALYNSAYESVTDNALDEYMALFASKTMQFVRAPDENVFIPPFNLIEVFFLVIPFEWWMHEDTYERLNSIVMLIIYSPLLLVTAYFERRTAYKVEHARARGDEDDDTIEEWEQLAISGESQDFEADGWAKTVERTRPNVATDTAVLEIRELREQVKQLQRLVESKLNKE